MSSWPSKPMLVLVLGDEVQEPGELGALALEVGVEQGVVALAAAPQDVVLAAQPLGDLEHVLDLRRGVGEDLGVGVGRGAGLVARVREQVGGAPQEADAGPLLVAQRRRRPARRGWRGTRRSSRPPGRRRGRGSSSSGVPSFSKNSNATAIFVARGGHRVAARLEPRPVQRPDPEHVHARATRTSARSRRPAGGGPPSACRARAGRAA